MTFKVGDKVRLTGTGWEEVRGFEIGGIYEISMVEDGVAYFTNGGVWIVSDSPDSDWGVELVSEAPSDCTGLPHLARRIRETIQPPSVAQAENQRLVSMALHRLADLLEEL